MRNDMELKESNRWNIKHFEILPANESLTRILRRIIGRKSLPVENLGVQVDLGL
jgi:hypothetical protein